MVEASDTGSFAVERARTLRTGRVVLEVSGMVASADTAVLA
jgi:hypothetical protein